jgi:hypothetical protein
MNRAEFIAKIYKNAGLEPPDSLAITYFTNMLNASEDASVVLTIINARMEDAKAKGLRWLDYETKSETLTDFGLLRTVDQGANLALTDTELTTRMVEENAANTQKLRAELLAKDAQNLANLATTTLIVNLQAAVINGATINPSMFLSCS